MDDPKGCDLIVCWEHNWADCPLEVIELKSTISTKPKSAELKDKKLPPFPGEPQATTERVEQGNSVEG